MAESKLPRAVQMMMQTNKMHRGLLEAKVKNFGMHVTSHRILMHIARCDKLMSQKELAEHLSITPAAVTGALKKLEADGYIKRTLGADNRFNEITLTERGKKIVNDTRSVFGDVDKALFDDFSEEELELYVRCLEKLQKNIKNQYTMKGKDDETMV